MLQLRGELRVGLHAREIRLHVEILVDQQRALVSERRRGGRASPCAITRPSRLRGHRQIAYPLPIGAAAHAAMALHLALQLAGQRIRRQRIGQLQRHAFEGIPRVERARRFELHGRTQHRGLVLQAGLRQRKAARVVHHARRLAQREVRDVRRRELQADQLAAPARFREAARELHRAIELFAVRADRHAMFRLVAGRIQRHLRE